MANRKKIGLALGSGAIRGLAHVGVIKSLVKHNIPIDYLAGSSIGAWVGVHYALYKDIAKLEELTLGMKKEKLLSFFEPSLTGGFIKGERVEKLLNLWLKNATFNDLKIPMKIVATDLISGEPFIFDKGNLALATRASMAVPSFFKPVNYKSYLLVDGGVSNPVPDNLVKQQGADIVIAVNLDNFGAKGRFSAKDTRFDKVAIRTIEIMRYNLAKHSTRQADIILELSLAKYSSWRKYFTSNIGPEIVKIGEQATDKIIPKLKALLKV